MLVVAGPQLSILKVFGGGRRRHFHAAHLIGLATFALRMVPNGPLAAALSGGSSLRPDMGSSSTERCLCLVPPGLEPPQALLPRAHVQFTIGQDPGQQGAAPWRRLRPLPLWERSLCPPALTSPWPWAPGAGVSVCPAAAGHTRVCSRGKEQRCGFGI